MTLSAVIVDDEKNITDLIENLIFMYCPDVTVSGVAHSVKQAVKVIREKRPNLIFLDVELPDGTGFDLLKLFPDRIFNVIFMTAYNQYAISAFKVNAIDYLLKPVDVDELIQAVKKAKDLRDFNKIKQFDSTRLVDFFAENQKRKLKVPTGEGKKIININDIIFIRADGAYSLIHTYDGILTISWNIKKFEVLIEKLPLFKVHKSFIINLEKIKNVHTQGHTVDVTMVSGDIISVSRTFKAIFLEALDNISF